MRAAWFLIVLAACSGDTALPMKSNCNPLGFDNCMAPWPSGVFEVDAQTPTGRKLAIPMGTLPTNFDGDAVDPTWLGEAGLDFVLFDFGGEISVLAMRHWTLLQLLMAGGAIAAGIAVLKIVLPAYLRSPRPGPHRVIGKVPIEIRPKTF